MYVCTWQILWQSLMLQEYLAVCGVTGSVGNQKAITRPYMYMYVSHGMARTDNVEGHDAHFLLMLGNKVDPISSYCKARKRNKSP